MPFYIRKSFSAGPIRLNLSKSGVGTSIGVKGARIGIGGPRGKYIHAGRHGLYYRKQLSASKSYSDSGSGMGTGCMKFIGFIIITIVAIFLIRWLVSNYLVPIFIIGGFAFMGGLVFLKNYIEKRRKEKLKSKQQTKLEQYKILLDDAFILSEDPPSNLKLEEIKTHQEKEISGREIQNEASIIEENVYRALLDKVLDDNKVTTVETTMIDNLDEITSLDTETKNLVKKETFISSYLTILQDNKVTNDEVDQILNLVDGLRIPEDIIRSEISTIQEFLWAQEINKPLEIVPNEKIPIHLPKAETPFYSAQAEVLRPYDSHDLAKSHLEIDHEGTLIITNKRILISNKGITAIKFSEIGNIVLDIDTRLIEISKTTSRKPMYIRTNDPISASRYMELILS